MVLPSGTAVLGSVAALTAVIIWRVQESRGPVSVKKIVIPPAGMATGFSMFLVPAFRIPLAWGVVAFLIGAVGLAYPLLRTTKLVREGDTVMMQRSKAFFAMIVALAAVRLLARGYLDAMISGPQTGGLLFVLAFGMILRWRVWMLKGYQRLMAAPRTNAYATGGDPQ
jgi:membrane protein CcdC involved in cytochrome C biogenesis